MIALLHVNDIMDECDYGWLNNDHNNSISRVRDHLQALYLYVWV